VTVEVDGSVGDGFVQMVDSLIRQNLERDPARRRLLRPSAVSIVATDADAEVAIVIGPGTVRVAGEPLDRPHLRIEGTSMRLLELVGAPLRLGLPDPFTPQGRAAVRDLATGRIRIHGMLVHPVRLVRLTLLISAR
jgi:hypothetical protein